MIPLPLKNERKKSENDKVKKRRKALGEIRRIQQCATKVLLEGQFLFDDEGNEYTIKHNRLIRTNAQIEGLKEIVTANRKTKELFFTPYKQDVDLMDENFPLILPKEEYNPKLYEAVKNLFDGKSELEEIVKQKKVLTDTEIPDEECYWKSLPEIEKQKLLDKLKKTEKDRPKTIIKDDKTIDL